MIGYLCGTLLAKQPSEILLEVNGVGYEIQLPTTAFAQLPSVGERLPLYTHLSIKEDGHYLYGFVQENQRALFRALIKVSGIGPRIALAIISSIEPHLFTQYVQNNDVDALVRVPGIGKKVAQRLIVEMRDKLSIFTTNDSLHQPQVGTHVSDAISALVNLGYKKNEALRAVMKHQDKNISSAELIRLALKEV